MPISPSLASSNKICRSSATVRLDASRRDMNNQAARLRNCSQLILPRKLQLIP
jgi:hypothetical protein